VIELIIVFISNKSENWGIPRNCLETLFHLRRPDEIHSSHVRIVFCSPIPCPHDETRPSIRVRCYLQTSESDYILTSDLSRPCIDTVCFRNSTMHSLITYVASLQLNTIAFPWIHICVGYKWMQIEELEAARSLNEVVGQLANAGKLLSSHHTFI